MWLILLGYYINVANWIFLFQITYKGYRGDVFCCNQNNCNTRHSSMQDLPPYQQLCYTGSNISSLPTGTDIYLTFSNCYSYLLNWQTFYFIVLTSQSSKVIWVRYNCMVEHELMVWIISCSSQYSTAGVTKVVVCIILFIGYKRSFVAHEVVALGFLSWYLSGSLQYIQCHITVNKMYWLCH